MECPIPRKHTQKIWCKSEHFPQRYKRKRECFFLNTVYDRTRKLQLVSCKLEHATSNSTSQLQQKLQAA